MCLGVSHFMDYVTSFNYCWAVAACSVLHDGVFAGGMRVSSPAPEQPRSEPPAERPLCTGQSQNIKHEAGCAAYKDIQFSVSSLAGAISKHLRNKSPLAVWHFCSHLCSLVGSELQVVPVSYVD